MVWTFECFHWLFRCSKAFHFYMRNKVEHCETCSLSACSIFNKWTHFHKRLIIKYSRISFFRYTLVMRLFSTCFIIIGEFLPHTNYVVNLCMRRLGLFYPHKTLLSRNSDLSCCPTAEKCSCQWRMWRCWGCDTRCCY
jgi:hypothetical protein